MKNVYAGGGRVRLHRAFAVSSLVFIALACVVAAVLISRFVSQRMIERDTETTTAFVQSLAVVQQARGYFLGHMPPDDNLNEFFRHVAAMPDVVRANIYARDRTVLWSSNPELVGRRFQDNDELDAVFMQKGETHSGVIGEDILPKAEHHKLDRSEKIIETYVAVNDPETRLVMGAIEFYKNPEPLWRSIDTLNRAIWAVAVGVGGVLYVALLLFMRRLGRQFSALNPDFRMAKRMGLTVARGMRELQQGEAGAGPTQAWIASLEAYAAHHAVRLQAAALPEVVNLSLHGLKPVFEAAGKQFSTDFPADLPAVEVDPVLLQIALDHVICHAADAMPAGGRLSITAHADEAHRAVYLEVRDGGGRPKDGTDPCTIESDDHALTRDLLERMGGKLFLAPLIDGTCDRTLRLKLAGPATAG